MMTIEKLMANLEEKVRNNQPISPAYWVETALRINQLRGNLDNKIANMKAMQARMKGEYIKAGEPVSKADALTKADETYEEYLKLEALADRITEWIRLAKRS